MLRELVVCINHRQNPATPSCAARGSLQIVVALEAAARAQGVDLTVTPIYCFGQCERGPNLRLAPGGQFYHHVRLEDVPGIVAALVDASE